MEYRKTRVKSLMGEITYERAYYRCGTCRWTDFPTDGTFGIQQKKTPGAREVIALVGNLQAFEEAAQHVLPRATGLRISASCVQQTTEAVGEDIARRRAAGETFGPAVAWKWHADAQGRRVAYLSLDATGVPQQGPHAEKAEAKMPWVAAVFNPQPPEQKRSQRVWEARYLSGIMSLPEIGAQLRRECQAVGVSQADLVICLTDGGNGLQDCLMDAASGLARDMEFILDFYHASEHVREFARALWPQDESRRQEQAQAWCHTLKHEGGRVLLAQLQALDLSPYPAAAIEAHRQLTGYLQNNLHRTDYPRYLANGWQIGSGMIESACKSVVGGRLKGPGMRWRPPGTTAVCQLRALYKSERSLWQHYWKPTTCA